MPDHHTSPVGEDAERAAFEAWVRKDIGMPNSVPFNWDAEWAKAAFEGWAERARRAAPALDASGLPPLPEADEYSATRMLPNGELAPRFNGMSMRQYAGYAVASRDAEIADLRAQLEGTQAHFLATQDQAEHYRAKCAAPTQPKAQVGTIEDYAQFHILHGAWMSARDYWQDDAAEQVAEAWRKFIDYIDAWAGSRAGDAAPDGWRLTPEQPTNKMTAIGQDLRYKSVNSIGAIYRAMLAAAPAPGKPAGNDQDNSA